MTKSTYLTHIHRHRAALYIPLSRGMLQCALFSAHVGCMLIGACNLLVCPKIGTSGGGAVVSNQRVATRLNSVLYPVPSQFNRVGTHYQRMSGSSGTWFGMTTASQGDGDQVCPPPTAGT